MIEYAPKQKQLMQMWQNNELARINLLEGSVSSGKTWISLVLWAFWVKTMPRDKLYLMTGKSVTTLKRNCLILLQEQVGERYFKYSLAAKEGYLFGRRVLLEGANDARSEAKIRGVTLQGAYCDELTQMPKDFFAMLLSRLRLPGAKVIATTNPDSPLHWLKTDYINRANELDMLDIKFTIADNPFLPEEYVRELETEYAGTVYKKWFIDGDWAKAEGVIYPMYEDALAEPPEDKASEYQLSIDYGTQNAFAAEFWERHGEIWYMSDLYYYSGRDTGRQKTDDDYWRDLEDFLVSKSVNADERPVTTIIDPSAASFIALLHRKPHFKVRKADNDVANGLRETAVAMKRGRIKISPRLKEWRKEIEGYVWDENKEEAPIKENDHAMDAMRYFVRTNHLARPVTKYIPVLK